MIESVTARIGVLTRRIVSQFDDRSRCLRIAADNRHVHNGHFIHAQTALKLRGNFLGCRRGHASCSERLGQFSETRSNQGCLLEVYRTL